MPVDKSAILKAAQLFTARGQYDKAIAEWQKLKAESPNDGAVSNTIGDLHLKRNALPQAIEAYFEAAAAFRGGGAALKAIALYRKILKLSPKQYQAYQFLADLNAARGLTSAAVQDYLTLARLQLKEGKPAEALASFQSLLQLDPGHADARQQVSELCRQLNLPEEPGQAAGTTGSGAMGGCPDARVAQPADVSVSPGGAPERHRTQEQAERLTANGKFREAEAMLIELLSGEPGDPQVCRLLAILHLRRGDVAVARSELQFLAEAAMRAQDLDLAESLVGEYLQVDRDCVSMLELLGQVYEHRGNSPAAVQQYARAIELLLAHPEPEMPTRPAELIGKIRFLDPQNPLVERLEAGVAQAGSGAAPGFVGEEATSEAEAAPPPSEHELRYELGQAYRNLGLLTEAIEEFRHAAGDQECFIDASRMLAACLKETGMIESAIRCLEQALADPLSEGEKALFLKYDLGVLCEVEGRLDRARKIYATIPGFLDVAARLQRLDRLEPSEASMQLMS